ncbi:unnamed protein product, partial [Heterosigma akashiwo]
MEIDDGDSEPEGPAQEERRHHQPLPTNSNVVLGASWASQHHNSNAIGTGFANTPPPGSAAAAAATAVQISPSLPQQQYYQKTQLHEGHQSGGAVDVTVCGGSTGTTNYHYLHNGGNQGVGNNVLVERERSQGSHHHHSTSTLIVAEEKKEAAGDGHQQDGLTMPEGHRTRTEARDGPSPQAPA